ncbi:MAG: LysE family transporter [Mucilaginibacter polytrichastri]|nr:LysE family transporter [Mucilaginibacter polytrichastri]
MFEAIITGIGLGLALSVLAGPVFFALIKTSIERGFSAGVAMALGVVSSDVVFVGAILLGSQVFSVDNYSKKIIGIVGSIVLAAIGIGYMFKKAKVTFSSSPSGLKKSGYVLKGFLMCIFNPTIFFHWIYVVGTASAFWSENIPHRHAKIAVMFATILLVQFGLDILKAFYANKLREKISAKTVQRLNYVAGIAIIIAAFILLDRLVTHFIFEQPRM